MLGIGRGMGVPLGKGISPGQMETRGRCPSLCQLGGEQTLLAEGLWEALHKNREKTFYCVRAYFGLLCFFESDTNLGSLLGEGWAEYHGSDTSSSGPTPYSRNTGGRHKITATGPSPTPTPGWGADETEGYWIGRGWGTHTDETIMSIKQFLPVSCGIGREE